MIGKKPELLCPAGDWERLKLAVAYGADAVYLAGTTFGMRSFAGNFTPEELPKAVAYAHEHGVRAHVTVNTMPRNNEVAQLPAWLELLDDAGVDALHPIQAQAANMDAKTLAREFNGKIIFVGGVDTQRLLPNGTPQQVKEEVYRLRDLFGPNYIVSPSHESILPDVPWENVLAMAEAAAE